MQVDYDEKIKQLQEEQQRLEATIEELNDYMEAKEEEYHLQMLKDQENYDYQLANKEQADEDRYAVLQDEIDALKEQIERLREENEDYKFLIDESIQEATPYYDSPQTDAEMVLDGPDESLDDYEDDFFILEGDENEPELCASGEGDKCYCRGGTVYYGERYKRIVKVDDDTSSAFHVDDSRELTFNEMLAYPYREKDMSDGGIMTQCTFSNFASENTQYSYTYEVKTDKQCFCKLPTETYQDWVY